MIATECGMRKEERRNVDEVDTMKADDDREQRRLPNITAITREALNGTLLVSFKLYRFL